MYEKLRIAYSREEIFGKHFKPSINDCYCRTAKIFFNNKINTDGSIELTKESKFKREDLWSYLYYLYYYNHSIIQEFKEIVNVSKDKSSAEKFYNIIIKIFNINDNVSKSAKPLDNIILIKFINYIIKEYSSKNLINPIFDYINILLRTQNIKIKNLNIKGDNIITDEEKIKNSNIVVKLINKNNDNIIEEKNKLFEEENSKYLENTYSSNNSNNKIKIENNVSSSFKQDKLNIEMKYYKYIIELIPFKEMISHEKYLQSKIGSNIIVNKYRKNKISIIRVIVNNIQLSTVLNILQNKYIYDIIKFDNKQIIGICKLPHYKHYRRINIILNKKKD